MNIYGEDFFYCVKLKCQLLKKICIKRQKEKTETNRLGDFVFLSCQDCEQGRIIKMEKKDSENSKEDAGTKTNKKKEQTKNCLECKEVFYKENRDASNWRTQRFCSVSCASKHRKKEDKKKKMEQSAIQMKEQKQSQINVSTLATEHWNYIENLLTKHMVDADLVEIVGFHYKTAFEHGWKHAMDAR